MSAKGILQELKKGQYAPIYFLQGGETYFIDQITDYCANHILGEGEKDFNQALLYGKDIEIQNILNECKQFPMMAEKRVVIVREAQELSRTIAKLVDYAKNPTPSTILVVNYKYKKIDGRSELSKLLKKNGWLHTFEELRDYQMGSYVEDIIREKGMTITPKAQAYLIECLGVDLGKIVKTIDKLQIVLEGDTNITDEIVVKHVGISKDFNVFELQKAIIHKDVFKSNLIANHFANNPKNYPSVVTISTLYSFFSKLLIFHDLKGKMDDKSIAQKMGINPYFIRDYAAGQRNYPLNKIAKIIGYLRESDLKCKGVGSTTSDDGQVLKELVFKILH